MDGIADLTWIFNPHAGPVVVWLGIVLPPAIPGVVKAQAVSGFVASIMSALAAHSAVRHEAHQLVAFAGRALNQFLASRTRRGIMGILLFPIGLPSRPTILWASGQGAVLNVDSLCR